mmetsp:Transcript_11318/g.28636  ORF Transcript_11318/g.28636 Transcript_11318/m.28636 type:complete len:315 (+) Transcript_11318:46-990(+)
MILTSALTFGAVPTMKLADGNVMPMIFAGTGGLDSPTSSIEAAFAAGFTGVDSALDYGNQQEVAKALATKPRESYFLTSKVPGCFAGVKVLPPLCYEDTKKAAELNLQRLNVSYVDLLLIHTPAGTTLFSGCSNKVNCEMMQHQWRAMEEVKKAGLAKSIGVSNYCPECVECIKKTATEMPVVNQVEFHVGQGKDAQGFKPYCDAGNITLMAYSPLGPWLGGSKDELIKGNLTNGIGKKHGKSSVQVALRWLAQRGVPIVTKSSNPAHLAADLDVFDWDLDEEDLGKLDASPTPKASRDSPSFLCKAEQTSVLV